MPDRKNTMFESSSYERRKVIIPAYGLVTMDYTAKRPNYYRVQNMGATAIYGGTMNVPNAEHFDFSVGAGKLKMYAEPFTRDSLYLYNPSGTPVEAVVLSFAAAFDPVTLAMSEMEIDLSGTVLEANMVVSGFNSPLPAGENKIGSVEVENLPNLATFATLAKQNEMLDHLSDVVGHLSDLVKDKNKYVDDTGSFNKSGQTGENVICGGGKCIIHILTNDGDTNIDLVLGGATDTQTFTLKPGETIQDFKFVGSVKVTGTNYSFRALVSYP